MGDRRDGRCEYVDGKGHCRPVGGSEGALEVVQAETMQVHRPTVCPPAAPEERWPWLGREGNDRARRRCCGSTKAWQRFRETLHPEWVQVYADKLGRERAAADGHYLGPRRANGAAVLIRVVVGLNRARWHVLLQQDNASTSIRVSPELFAPRMRYWLVRAYFRGALSQPAALSTQDSSRASPATHTN